MKKQHLLILFISLPSFLWSQNDTNELSNIQTFTPSVLLSNRQWDIKFFNNLYTENKSRFNGVKADIPRQNFLTSTFEVFTGVSESKRINLGMIFEHRSNNIGGNSATSVLGFRNNSTSRNGLSSIAPTIKWQPI